MRFPSVFLPSLPPLEELRSWASGHDLASSITPNYPVALLVTNNIIIVRVSRPSPLPPPPPTAPP